MGYLVDEKAPIVWRGLMVMKALQQLLHEVDWGGLDVLVLDLPPGTGDTQLTITQQVKLDGVIIHHRSYGNVANSVARNCYSIYTSRHCAERRRERCCNVPQG